MRKWMRKLWNDERGNALIIAVGAMPMVIGSAGLATDTVQWALMKRQLQRAADSSAMAGAFARYQSQDVTSAVTNDLLQSNQTGETLTGTPAIDTTLPDSADALMKVKVTLSLSKRLPFSSFFTGESQTINATATAAAVDDGEYCVVALNRLDTDVTIQGSVNINLGCGAFANSAYDPYEINGSEDHITFIASPIAAAGDIEDSDIWGTSVIQEYRMPQNDPFANTSTSVPAGTTCNKTPASGTSAFVKTGTEVVKIKGVNTVVDVGYTVITLSPGCYSNFSLSGNQRYTLTPGTYYLWETDFQVNAGTVLTGTGVTFVLTGNDAAKIGTLAINGDSTLTLSAPTEGDYKNFLFVQSPNATKPSTINGNSSSFFDGALYFPNTEVTVSGSNSGLTKCAMIVSKTVTFAGNAEITNDPDACLTDHSIPLKVIRLVA